MNRRGLDQRRREAAQAEGVCVACLTRDASLNRVMCQRCRRLASERYRKRVREKRPSLPASNQETA